jgi:hypothetical protein
MDRVKSDMLQVEEDQAIIRLTDQNTGLFLSARRG